MPIGQTIRYLLGPRTAFRVGRFYRAIFVDLSKVATELAAAIPHNAHLLDVGGGDGQPLNYLLSLRPDLMITTLDPGPNVGQWIEERFHNRVMRLPATTLADYVALGQTNVDAMLISDVMHHIPEDARRSFLGSVRILIERLPGLRIIVKDVEPGYLRAFLGYWSDRYVTGDRNVSLVSKERLTRVLEEVLGPLHCEETNLFNTDCPNYCLIFYR